MTTLELIEKHGIGHNCLADAYELGRADGYSQAETDYHKQTEKDRQSAYDCGYELGRQDVIDEALQIFHNVYTQNLYCMEDECESKRMDCDGCLYITFQKHLKLLKGGVEE